MRQAPLTIELRPSHRLTMALAIMHALALAALWIADGLPLWGRLVPTGLLLVSAAFHFRRVMVADIAAIELRQDCTAAVRIGEGWVDAGIAPGAVALPQLIVLPLALDGMGTRRILLLPDAADAESLRRLRVLLRWRCAGLKNRTATP